MKILSHFFLYQLGLAKAWTFYTEAECKALQKYAANKTRLAEIGCWQGVNTRNLREVMAPNGVLFAIDPYFPGRLGFNASQIIAHREVSKIKNGEVRWLRMTDLQAAAHFKKQNERPLDFIFSDSLNTYEGFKATWEAWSPQVASKGIYVLANSRSSEHRNFEGAGSVEFTKNVAIKDPRFKHLENVGTFTFLEKL